MRDDERRARLPLAAPSDAGSGLLGLDHELPLDQIGIWARKDQLDPEYAVLGAEVAGSLWLGNDHDLGHTLRQTVDSSAIPGIAAELLKYSTSRARA